MHEVIMTPGGAMERWDDNKGRHYLFHWYGKKLRERCTTVVNKEVYESRKELQRVLSLS
jgi:hypothetical protein